MPLGLGSSQWAVVLPKEATNIHENPSLERGTTGWSALAGGASIGSTSYKQAFGAWSLQVNHLTTSEGAFYNAGTPTAGSYTISGFVNGTSGHRYRLLAETAGGAPLGAGSITSVGGWQSIVASFGLASGTGLNIVARHIDSADGTFYLDGLQLESGTNQTTYIDGDQPGGTWQGAPHVSQSFRTGQYRGGGTVIALGDLGFRVDQMPGAGVPPIEVSAQSYAVVDGAQFQRQRAAARTLTLTAQPFLGTTLADFHVTRRTVWDALKPDAVTPQQPVRFLYVGGQGTSQIDAYYQNGMELGDMNGPMAEGAAVAFLATDPYFYSPTQQGTTLNPRVNLGSVNYIAKRNPQGQWGTLGANGSTIFNPTSGPITVWDLAFNSSGTLFLGGNWGTLAGTVAPGIGMYFSNTNRFGTLAGGTIGNDTQVVALTFNPSGTLFIGGNFAEVAGTAANAIARWTGAFGTLQGGTVSASNGLIWDLLYSPLGTLFLAGRFNSVAGTANSRALAMWTGAFGTLGGTVGINAGAQEVRALAWGLDKRLFFGGVFNTINGTAGTAVGFWKSGAFGTMGTLNDWAFALGVAPSGRLYAGGQFVVANGGSALRIAEWNGVSLSALGNGLGNEVESILADSTTGNVYIGGAFTSVGSVNAAANYAVWNGYTYLLPDINFNVSGFTLGTVRSIALATDRTLYIAGDFAGTAQAASVGTIINSGRAQAYPTLRLRNYGAGTARIYQLLNTTTGNGIYFNYVMLGGENAKLVLQPGARSFQSDAQGNVFGLILPGSNLATWSLLPGTNYVSFFSDSGSVEAAFYWQPRGWAADSGTNY